VTWWPPSAVPGPRACRPATARQPPAAAHRRLQGSALQPLRAGPCRAACSSRQLRAPPAAPPTRARAPAFVFAVGPKRASAPSARIARHTSVWACRPTIFRISGPQLFPFGRAPPALRRRLPSGKSIANTTVPAASQQPPHPRSDPARPPFHPTACSRRTCISAHPPGSWGAGRHGIVPQLDVGRRPNGATCACGHRSKGRHLGWPGGIRSRIHIPRAPGPRCHLGATPATHTACTHACAGGRTARHSAPRAHPGPHSITAFDPLTPLPAVWPLARAHIPPRARLAPAGLLPAAPGGSRQCRPPAYPFTAGDPSSHSISRMCGARPAPQQCLSASTAPRTCVCTDCTPITRHALPFWASVPDGCPCFASASCFGPPLPQPLAGGRLYPPP
jgi:hypothetical protein